MLTRRLVSLYTSDKVANGKSASKEKRFNADTEEVVSTSKIQLEETNGGPPMDILKLEEFERAMILTLVENEGMDPRTAVSFIQQFSAEC